MKMRTLAAWMLCLTSALSAQQLKLNLDAMAAKASNKVDISLTSQTLQFAARFLEGDGDEAQVKKLIAGLEGIYLRSYEFKQDNAFSPADVEAVRSQLKAPEWSRILGIDSTDEGETAELHVRYDANKRVNGLVVLVTGPREFTVVNIVGAVDLENLAQLSGHFGVPKLIMRS